MAVKKTGISRDLIIHPGETIADGKTIYIAEGEKDVETLSKMGYIACTVGGASDWKEEYAKFFKGAKVVILPDNDEPGKTLATQIKRGIKNYAYCVKIVTTSNMQKGDITDYIEKEKHAKDDFERLVNNTEWHYNFCDNKGKVNTDLLADNFCKNEKFIQITRETDDKFDMYFYKSGVYTQQGKNQVKGEIKEYIPLGHATDKMLSDTFNLLQTYKSNVYSAEALNADTNYINLKNGLYDIITKKLIPHDSKIKSTIQLKCNYNETAPKPKLFLKFIDDMCTDESGNIDNDKKLVTQEWLGISLSNIDISSLKKCFILYSTKGNTGKSVLLNIISGMIGEKNTINIPMQKLNDRFSMGDVYGKRLIIVGDQESGSMNNVAMFKQLTGGDSIRVEQKGRTSFEYHFKGGLLMACNDLPQIKDDKGDHLFERMHIIPLVNSIAEEKRDKDLLQKIMHDEKEGVFMWALEGLHRFIDNEKRFTGCMACTDIMQSYRSELDTAYEFLNRYYILTGKNLDRIKTTELFEDYAKWCLTEERNPLTKRSFKERMGKNGITCSSLHGYSYYKGIKKKDFIDITEKEDFAENVFQEKCV